MFIELPIKFPTERLLHSYQSLKNELQPISPYENIPGSWKWVWSLKSDTGNYTDNIKSIRKNKIRYDHQCKVPTQAYSYFDYVMDLFPQSCRVRITVLSGNNYLPEHNDEDVWRFHIPIVPNKNFYIKFHNDNNLYSMTEAGRLYCFDASISHSVFNGGETDRVHLIWSINHKDINISLLNNYIKK